MRGSSRIRLVWFTVISALYFTDTLLRASLKRFWFDELYTVYLCRMPTFRATWKAVTHGCDFNLPVLYLLTRAGESLFGEGQIATRLPQILGFWLFGICLYLFVSRRLGPLRGAIAAMLPVFTMAHTYAYEARAHGILLAWCGLMLICWQRSLEDEAPRWRISPWTLGFFLSFLGALGTHVYGIYLSIPFFLVELFALRRRRLQRGILASLLVAPLFVLRTYAFMAKTYARMQPVRGLTSPFYTLIREMLIGIYGPTLLLLLVAVALMAWSLGSGSRLSGKASASTAEEDTQTLSRDELILAAGFLFYPIVGCIGIQISKGPFFDRYFLSTVAGLSLIAAQATMLRRSGAGAARGLFALLLVLLLSDSAIVTRAFLGRGAINQIEPASHLILSSDRGNPLARDEALVRNSSGLDVLVLEDHNFLYLAYYAPPQIRSRLIFGAERADDLILASDRLLTQWAGAGLRTATFDEFFATHNDFLVYSTIDGFANGQCLDCIQSFLKAGYKLRSVDRDPDSLLEHFSR